MTHEQYSDIIERLKYLEKGSNSGSDANTRNIAAVFEGLKNMQDEIRSMKVDIENLTNMNTMLNSELTATKALAVAAMQR